MYKYRTSGDKYVLSLDNHVEISAALAAFCKDLNIRCGAVYGLGAISEATFRFLDPATKKSRTSPATFPGRKGKCICTCTLRPAGGITPASAGIC